MAEDTQPATWEGKATAELKGLRAEQVWPLLEDFCNLHKVLPSIDTCYQLEGVTGEPGVIRHCAVTTASLSNSLEEDSIKWANEKLLSINSIERSLSYEVLDNNVGFKSYVATIKVLPINGGDGEQGCQIEWSFIADPIEGWRSEDLVSYIDSSLQSMARKIEVTLHSTE